MNQVKQSIGLVYIHGAGLQREIWTEVEALLDYPVLKIAFPRNADKQLMIEDYISYMQQQIETWSVDKFVIVAHSIGGLLGLKLAEIFENRMVGFIAVGAAIPKNGGSFLSVFPYAKRVFMSLLLRIFGTKPPEAAIRQGLCNDLTDDQTTEILTSFTPESLNLYTDRLEVSISNAAKMYVKLMNDQEFFLPLQDQMIANLVPQKVAELNTGHLPMLSNPKQLSLIIKDFMVDLQ